MRTECLKCPFQPTLRAQVQIRVTIAGGNRQQCSKKRCDLGYVATGLIDQRFELRELLRIIVLRSEPGGSFEYLGDGDELIVTQSAVVLEQLVSKFLFNADSEKGTEE